MVSIYYVLAPFLLGKGFLFMNPLAKAEVFPPLIELSEVKFYAKRKGT